MSLENPLDEIQWRNPSVLPEMQGIHSNSVLFYFAESPFFDPTSNNAVILTQARINPSMAQYVATRELFEGRLRTMNGLEFMVAEQPAQSAPGTGTGVWVIRKQTRRKRPGEEDQITVHAAYYVVGENIYQASTFLDIMSSRMATITSCLQKCFPAAEEARVWTPAQGHSYKALPPPPSGGANERGLVSKEATPMPDSQTKKPSQVNPPSQSSDARLAEQSFAIQMQFGAEYMDENPIAGKPGEFHLSSTGRKEKLRVPAPRLNPLTTAVKPAAAPEVPSKKESNKGDKTPKTPTGGVSKPKRKRTKAGTTPVAS